MNIIYSKELTAARDGQGGWTAPVVAFESTIITHGMPWPQNLNVARDVEDVVRAQGALPATIAVLNGTLHIGLNAAQLETLAGSQGAMKLSRADLPFAMATGRTGATTVAATMMAAHMAGIRVFATGGIGGVHRGADRSFDISADLQELSRTPITVVCAGAKAILDLPKTLEVLETLGVPVMAVGQSEFPAFWARTSGLPAPLRVRDAAQIAQIIQTRAHFPNIGGQVVANPIPHDHEIPLSQITPIIHQALAEAKNISGKEVTPFLLSRIFDLTEGRSLTANIALVRNNAGLAAQIACAL